MKKELGSSGKIPPISEEDLLVTSQPSAEVGSLGIGFRILMSSRFVIRVEDLA